MVLIYNKRLEVHYSVILERIPKCHMTPNETSTWQWWEGKLNFKRRNLVMESSVHKKFKTQGPRQIYPSLKLHEPIALFS